MIENKRTEAAEELDKATKESTPKLETLAAELATAKQKADGAILINQAKSNVTKYQSELTDLESESEEYTNKINALDAIKADLVSNLPIAGLEVKDGDIYLDGVQFDSVNESARMRFALQVAGLRKSELPLCCADGLEALDEKSMKTFIEEAEKTDLQFFVTRVSDEAELTINGKAVA
jgi:hypothetical protein